MTKPDDISATEKLLELIRSSQRPPPPSRTGDETREPLPVPEDLAALPLAEPHPPPGTAGLVLEGVEPTPAPLPEPAPAAEADPAGRLAPAAPRPRRAAPATGRRRFTLPLLPGLAAGGGLAVGIEIGADALCLVKASGGLAHPCLLDSQYLPYAGRCQVPSPVEARTLTGDDRFGRFLAEALAGFVGRRERARLWCVLPRQAVTIHHLTVPRVAKRELANVVFWAAKKELTLDEGATVLDYTLLGEVTVAEVPKLAVLVLLANRQEVAAWQGLFRGLGFPLTGLASSAVALQNLLESRWLGGDGDAYSLLHLDEQESFIDVYLDRQLLFSRDIKTGIGSLLESMVGLKTAGGAIPDEDAARRLLLGSRDAGPGLDIIDLRLPATDRLVRQLERTFDYCATHFACPRPSHLFLTGSLAGSASFARLFASELGLACSALDPFAVDRPLLGTALPPPQPAQRAALGPAFGLALSDGRRTPNCLQPQKEREAIQRSQRLSQVASAGFLALLAASTVLFAWQRGQVRSKEERRAFLARQLAAAVPPGVGQLDQALLLDLVARIRELAGQDYQRAKEQFEVALLAELLRLTPPAVRLISLTVTRGAASDRNRTPPYGLAMEGLVTGPARQLELKLAALVANLSASPFFQTVTIRERSARAFRSEEVLHFVVELSADRLDRPAAGAGPS
ncbi:MAG: hypothetical protein AB1634_13065 [Thermodesulfobacteriota bacterium]